MRHLKAVFQILSQHKLFLKHNNCCFGTDKVEYLGHVISQGTVSMEPAKIESVMHWPIPQSLKELRGFLGLSGYYRRFIKHYGGLARPLTDLKKGVWQWFEQSTHAFEQLKRALCSALMLVLPNFQLEFCVDTDASGFRVGASSNKAD